jgi:hypothetical protein
VKTTAIKPDVKATPSAEQASKKPEKFLTIFTEPKNIAAEAPNANLNGVDIRAKQKENKLLKNRGTSDTFLDSFGIFYTLFLKKLSKE